MGDSKLMWVLPAVVGISAVILYFLSTNPFGHSADTPPSSMPETELIGKNKIKSATTGEVVTVESLWEKQPVVITFFRRWGCIFCRSAAQKISDIKEELDAHNVRLVGIGVEDLGKEEFIKGEYFKGDLFIDEERKCYNDLGYKRFGVLGLMREMLTKTSFAAFYNRGSVSGDLKGDYYQVGGTLVISEGGSKVLLSFKQASLADSVDPNEVLKSLGIPPKDLKVETEKDDKAQCSMDEKSSCQ